MRTFHTISACALAIAVISGCSTVPATNNERVILKNSGQTTVDKMAINDPTLSSFLNDAYGYAVFPEVGKAGLIVGGAYGRGIVYEHGSAIGYADITNATVGLQAGGQTFSQIIAFKDKEAMNRFKYGDLKLSANVSAVLLKAGAAESARYSDGVVVFVEPIGGAMVEASIGGQTFNFVPRENVASADWDEMD